MWGGPGRPLRIFGTAPRRQTGHFIVTALSKEAASPPDIPARLAIEPGEVIGAFPGAAALFDSRGRLIAANVTAVPLAEAMQAGALPQLGEAIKAVNNEAKSRVERVDLQSDDVETALDVTLLPVWDEKGEAHVLALSRESTLERNFINALVASRQLFKDLVSCSSDFAWETQADGALGFVSNRGALGYSPRELQGRSPRAMLVDPGHEGPFPFEWREPLEDVEVWLLDSSGEPACLLTSSVPRFSEDGQWEGARGVCRDVTEARKRDAALERADSRERLLSEIIDSIRNQLEPGKMLRAAAASAASALGADHCWILRGWGTTGFSGIVHSARGETPQKLPEAFARNLDQLDNGRAVTMEIEGFHVLAAPARYRGVINGAIGVARHDPVWDEDSRALVEGVADHLGIAIEQIESHNKLERMTRVDELTGLLNRRAFFQDIEKRMKVLQRSRRSAALFYVDLDNFKQVNDQHGHAWGDEALAALALILSRGTRVGDLLARMGGDEFALWLEETDAAAAESKARSLIEECESLQRFSGSPSEPLGISVGIAILKPPFNESLKNLITRADQAMYQIKRGTKGGYAFAPDAAAGPEASQ